MVNDKEGKIGLVIVIVALLAVAAIYYTSMTASEAPDPDAGEQVFCTQDAQECSDGSFVGRVAPDCEFAACPNT